MITTCKTCNKEEDCRPYGAGAAMICYDCMMASPEREKEAERQFKAQFMAAAEVSQLVIIDGVGGTGPMPYKGQRQ